MQKEIKKRINTSYFNIFKEFPLLLKVITKYSNKFNNDKPNLNKRILIVNTSLIGDFIVSLPAIYNFIKSNQNSSIDIIVSKPLKLIAQNINGINHCYTMKNIFNNDNNEIIEIDKDNYYDLLIIMRTPKNILKLLDNIQFTSIKTYFIPYIKYGIDSLKTAFTKKEIKQLSQVNFEIIGIEQNLSNEINYKDLLNIKFKDQISILSSDFYQSTIDSKRIIIHTGSGWEIKFWSINNWINLINKIHKTGNCSFFFIGSSEQERLHFKQISSKLDFKVYSLIDKVNLYELLVFCTLSDFFIGIDSGPRHIVHLVDLPSISLLGPGPKSFKPLNKNATIIDKSDCNCTNLFCNKKTTCMELISWQEVFNEFLKKI